MEYFSFNSYAVAGSLEETYRIARDNGLYIEVSPLENDEFLETTGIKPYSVHIDYRVHLTDPDKDIRDRDLDYCMKVLRKAHESGAKVCVLHVEEYIVDRPFEERVNTYIETISPLIEKADSYGIKIAIENTLYRPGRICATPEELKYVIDRLKEKYSNVGICLDSGHANISAEDERTNFNGRLEDWLDYFRDDIIHVHLHENHGKERKTEDGDILDEHLPPSGLFSDEFYKKLVNLPNLITINFEINPENCRGIDTILKAKEFTEKYIEIK